VVDDGVVEGEEADVKLRDDDVLVVPRVAEAGRDVGVVGGARLGRLRQRPARAAELDEERLGRLERRQQTEEPSEAALEEERARDRVEAARCELAVARGGRGGGCVVVDRHAARWSTRCPRPAS
jgi:hypothetical protein